MRTNKKYSIEQKLKAVLLYLHEGISAKDVAKELGIQDEKRVRIWARKYEEGDALSLESQTGKLKGSTKGRPKKNFETHEDEMEYLKAENAYLRLMMKYKDEYQKKSSNSK